MSITDRDAGALASNIVACIERADYSGLGELYAVDAVLDMNLPTWRFQYQGAEAIRTYLRDQTSGLRGLRCTQSRSVATDDTVVVESECRFDGDDGEYLWRCVDILSCRGSEITGHTQYCTGCWTPADIARQAAEAPMVRW